LAIGNITLVKMEFRLVLQEGQSIILESVIVEGVEIVYA
jgi:hypothetical protein